MENSLLDFERVTITMVLLAIGVVLMGVVISFLKKKELIEKTGVSKGQTTVFVSLLCYLAVCILKAEVHFMIPVGIGISFVFTVGGNKLVDSLVGIVRGKEVKENNEK